MALKLIQSTVSNLLEYNALHYGNQCAIVYREDNIRYTWSGLNNLVEEAAKGLFNLGVRKGDHIAIWGINKPIWLVTQLATARIGAVLVTINPEWKEKEIEYALKQSDTTWLVMMEGFEKKGKTKNYYYNYLDIIKSICPEFFNSDISEDPACKKLPALKCIVLETLKTSRK